MNDIKTIFNNFIQTFLDFTGLLWQSGDIGKIILTLGIIGVAIVIAFKIINMTRGQKI